MKNQLFWFYSSKYIDSLSDPMQFLSRFCLTINPCYILNVYNLDSNLSWFHQQLFQIEIYFNLIQ